MTGLYHWVIDYLESTMAGNLTFQLYAIRPPPSLAASRHEMPMSSYALRRAATAEPARIETPVLTL